MGKTITIRKSAEDEAWLKEEQKRTKLSQGAILKNLLASARKAKPHKKDNPWLRYAGIIKGLSPDLSEKKGFER